LSKNVTAAKQVLATELSGLFEQGRGGEGRSFPSMSVVWEAWEYRGSVGHRRKTPLQRGYEKKKSTGTNGHSAKRKTFGGTKQSRADPPITSWEGKSGESDEGCPILHCQGHRWTDEIVRRGKSLSANTVHLQKNLME